MLSLTSADFRFLQLPEAASNAILYCCETERLLDQMAEITRNFVVYHQCKTSKLIIFCYRKCFDLVLMYDTINDNYKIFKCT